MQHRARGLTLIEMMVTVAIIAILAGIAWPIYEAQSMKQRRTEAPRAITRAANSIQECYRRTWDFTQCQDVVADINAELRYYEVDFDPAPTDATYTLVATPIAGGSQADDTECTGFSLTHLGRRDATSSDASLDTQEKRVRRCWGQ